MKKNYPLLIMFAILCVALVRSDLLSLNMTSAERLSVEEGKKANFEDLARRVSFQTMEGKKININQASTPVVVVNFWASWCTPCLKEIPSLKGLQEKYGTDKLMVLAVNQDDEEKLKAINKITDKYQTEFTNILDKDQKIIDQYKVVSLPYTIIYGKGRVLHVSEEEENFLSEKISQKIDAVLRD